MYQIYLELSAVKHQTKFMCDCIIKKQNKLLISKRIILSQSYFRYNKYEFSFQMLFNLISFCEKQKYKGNIEIIHNINDLDYYMQIQSKYAKGTRKSFLRKYVYLLTQGYGFKIIYDINRACEENQAILVKNISYEKGF